MYEGLSKLNGMNQPITIFTGGFIQDISFSDSL